MLLESRCSPSTGNDGEKCPCIGLTLESFNDPLSFVDGFMESARILSLGPGEEDAGTSVSSRGRDSWFRGTGKGDCGFLVLITGSTG